MDNKENTKISENKRICIATIILVVLLAASVIALIILYGTKKERNIATIYVDGIKYTEIDLAASEDIIFTITASNGSKNTIEIKDHNIRMHSAECKNNLCVRRGWADDTLLPIVCLPNNVVITVTQNNTADKEDYNLDAITY